MSESQAETPPRTRCRVCQEEIRAGATKCIHCESSQEVPSATKACAVCGESIKATATKCTKCSSYQNFRRHLDFGSVILSVLAVVIAVLTATIPTVKWLLTRERSAITVQLLETRPKSIFVACRNRGSRPGVIYQAEFTTRSGARCHLKLPTPTVTIAAKEIATLELTYVIQDIPEAMPREPGTLLLTIIPFGGENETVSQPMTP